MKKIYGLIGHPVKHSLSALMHNAAFKELGLNAEYRLFDKETQEVGSFLQDLTKQDCDIFGLNVTIPHKVTVHDFLLDSLSDSARKIGAVNTIIVREENRKRSLTGDNTDGTGFLESLRNDLKFDAKDKVVFVLGAGGAARAIIMSLGGIPEKIYFTDIDETRVATLESDYKKVFGEGRIFRVGEKDKTDCIRIADLLVNATNIGMKETDPLLIDPQALHNNMSVFDVIYSPKETKLIKLAGNAGLACVNGLGMLLYQGVQSFRLWTNEDAPVETMRNVLKEAVK